MEQVNKKKKLKRARIEKEVVGQPPKDKVAKKAKVETVAEVQNAVVAKTQQPTKLGVNVINTINCPFKYIPRTSKSICVCSRHDLRLFLKLPYYAYFLVHCSNNAIF